MFCKQTITTINNKKSSYQRANVDQNKLSRWAEDYLSPNVCFQLCIGLQKNIGEKVNHWHTKVRRLSTALMYFGLMCYKTACHQQDKNRCDRILKRIKKNCKVSSVCAILEQVYEQDTTKLTWNKNNRKIPHKKLKQI